jgi:hypothetical protein
MRLRLAGHQNGSHRGRRFALAALLAIVCLAILAPRAHGAKGMEVALNDDPILVGQGPVGGHPGPAPGLGFARELRVSRIRVNVGWASSLAAGQRDATSVPSEIRYDYARFDQLVVAATRWGFKLQLNLSGPTPRWATGDGREGANRPNAKLFRHFVTATATHYRGLVDRYSIWNEPNHVGWIAPVEEAGTIYRALYTPAYRAIKKVDPKAKVLIAETSPYELYNRSKKIYNAVSPLAFLRQMTCSNESFTKSECPGLKADGYAHHPYDYAHEPSYRYPGKDNATLGTLSNLTNALNRMNKTKALRTPKGKALDVYLTEYGYLRQGKKATEESARAKYLVQAFKLAQKNKRVKQMLQYLLVEPARHKFFDTSIVLQDGTRTPAYNALASWSQKAADKKLIKSPGRIDPTLSNGGAGAGTPPAGNSGGGAGGNPGNGGGAPFTGTPAEPVCTLFPDLCATVGP